MPGSVKCARALPFSYIYFVNDPATTEIYPLSLHDALPIFAGRAAAHIDAGAVTALGRGRSLLPAGLRSEEHTSELQSQSNLVCRLVLEKNNATNRGAY